MRNTIYAAMFAALAFSLTACPASNITPGGKCSAEGSKHTNEDGYSYTCRVNPNNGVKVWMQDQPLTPDRP